MPAVRGSSEPTKAKCLRDLVQAPWFQRGVMAVIVVAGIIAGLETDPVFATEHQAVLRAIDLVVLIIFAVEILLRIAAYIPQPWRFFQDGWNVFDFLIVLVCALPLDAQFAAVLRLARALRLLRLVSALPKLQLLVGALLNSLGAMGYVGLLLALMFYIYGVAGVHLFRAVDPEHFGSLGAALLALFQIITLDNWSDIYGAASARSPAAALAYFISFILLGTMIMLNLFIGIIMNSMAEMHAEIEGRDRARHLQELGRATLLDELNLLEQQLNEAKKQAAHLRWRLNPHRPAELPPPRA